MAMVGRLSQTANPNLFPGRNPAGYKARITAVGVIVHDTPDRHICGGQVWAVDASDLTVRCHVEQSLVQNVTVPRSLAATAIKGDPIVLEMTRTPGGAVAGQYTIVAAHSAPFAGAGPSGSQAESVDRGEFHPGRVQGFGVKEFLD